MSAIVPGPGGAALLFALAVPLAMLAACLRASCRPAIFRCLGLAALPALLAALVDVGPDAIVVDPAGLQLTLGLDRPRAILLGATALLWSVAGWYAPTYHRREGRGGLDDRDGGSLAIAWLACLAGCIGVFIAGDLVSFYAFFALASLPAYGLVIHDRSAAARRAAGIYLLLAIIGEAFLLLGFVLLAKGSPDASLRISTVVAALPEAALRSQAVLFLLLGLGMKAGLVPLHFWLPLAHPAAPMPASAVLSGALIKTGIIGLIVMLPFGAATASAGVGAAGAAAVVGQSASGAIAQWASAWSAAIVAIGFITAFAGAGLGFVQSNPKTILAYSSVSQMGLIVAILGAGLAPAAATDSTNGPGESIRLVASCAALHHALVKGALFLGLGVIAATGHRRRRAAGVAMALLALSLAGLPLTGGALAKLAAKPIFGAGIAGALAFGSAVASALLMTRFVSALASIVGPTRSATAPIGLALPWWILAVGAFIVPWIVLPSATEVPRGAAFAPGALWDGLWPVILGALLAEGIRRSRTPLPRIPEGDIVVPLERDLPRLTAAAEGFAGALDAATRSWRGGGIALLGVLVGLIALALVGLLRG
ncbi:MAG TPA: proton-conducting transporter membrane subunit [Phycisphaerales bacterium]|nr:proton-conducting transporter membrane subunit [Phycisphaerales bacterium]HMP36683.1 proton-conducting transporter membrane subunit [Phycisphaerales bacterium]